MQPSFDTIAAVSTGRIPAGVGIIRISGPEAIAVAERVFTPDRGAPLSQREARRLILGTLRDGEGRVLDHCMATVSRAPASYTGEDTAELQCHGSPVVLREGLRALFAAGARQAEAGEFTRRAFLNGRMDLVQAEAVIDLIDAETAEAARNAAGLLGGSVRRRTDSVYDSLTAIRAHYHAVLDWPDEDIEEFELASYRDTLRESERELARLLDGAERGAVLTRGVRAVLTGRPNVGKSSLLNALVGYERAIVTDIPGTTRDTVTERALVGGVLLRLADTAGQRETGDIVERLGVERARSAAAGAELVLAVLDGSEPLTPEDEGVLAQALAAPRHILLANKADLGCREELLRRGAIPVSAKTGEGLDRLAEAVRALYPAGETDSGAAAGELLTSARQADTVRRALEHVRAALEAMDAGMTPDVVLTELEGAQDELAALSGRSVHEDILTGIFSRFCVGK